MKKILCNILIAAISIAGVTFVVEISLKLYAPIYHTGYIGVYQYDDVLGSILKPGIHNYNTTDYQQEVRTNVFGTVNFQESFQGYNKMIFTLGDSYTQGTGLPSDASYPSQLDLLLNFAGGVYEKKYGVINLGLAAFGAEQSYLSLIRFRDKFGEPDYILYLGASNDYLDDLKFRQGYKHKNFVDGSPAWGIFVKPLQWLRNDFEIGKRLFFVVDSIREKLIFEKDRESHARELNASVAEQQINMLEKYLKYSEEHDSKLIISWGDMPGSDGSYEFLKLWASKNKVLFADWYAGVASVKNAIPDIPFVNSHSGGHYRTWVNQLIARSFADIILNG